MPVVEQLIDELQDAEIIHVDETPWYEKGHFLWLWVVLDSTKFCPNGLYAASRYSGHRSKSIFSMMNFLKVCSGEVFKRNSGSEFFRAWATTASEGDRAMFIVRIRLLK